MSALTETIRVKLSSESAGYVSITPVVVQELPVRETALPCPRVGATR